MVFIKNRKYFISIILICIINYYDGFKSFYLANDYHITNLRRTQVKKMWVHRSFATQANPDF
ncbi:hypothetical protein GCM10022397_23800 [Flavivirga jejuensis]